MPSEVVAFTAALPAWAEVVREDFAPDEPSLRFCAGCIQILGTPHGSLLVRESGLNEDEPDEELARWGR